MKKSGRLGSRCISSSDIIAGGPYDGGVEDDAKSYSKNKKE